MQAAEHVGIEVVPVCHMPLSATHMPVKHNHGGTLYTASTVAASMYGSDGTLVSLMRSSNARACCMPPCDAQYSAQGVQPGAQWLCEVA